MSKRMFTDDQIKELLENKNVIKCSAKSIGYSPDFKASALKSYHSGSSPREIFEAAGFKIETIGRETPKECLVRWRRKAGRQGPDSLLKDGRSQKRRSGRPKKLGQSDREKIEYLEAKVAYLKAENDFLIKLRAARRE